jgi:hypothetical protein
VGNEKGEKKRRKEKEEKKTERTIMASFTPPRGLSSCTAQESSQPWGEWMRAWVSEENECPTLLMFSSMFC